MVRSISILAPSKAGRLLWENTKRIPAIDDSHPFLSSAFLRDKIGLSNLNRLVGHGDYGGIEAAEQIFVLNLERLRQTKDTQYLGKGSVNLGLERNAVTVAIGIGDNRQMRMTKPRRHCPFIKPPRLLGGFFAGLIVRARIDRFGTVCRRYHMDHPCVSRPGLLDVNPELAQDGVERFRGRDPPEDTQQRQRGPGSRQG